MYFLLPLKTLALLESFKTKLSSAITETPSVPEKNIEELDEDDDKGWWVAFTQFCMLCSPFLQRFNALMDMQLSVIKCILNNSCLIGCPNAQLLFHIKVAELFIWTNIAKRSYLSPHQAQLLALSVPEPPRSPAK